MNKLTMREIREQMPMLLDKYRVMEERIRELELLVEALIQDNNHQN